VNKRKKTMNLIELNSVGCVIDENGVTYPQYPDNEDGTFGGYDEDGACNVNDIENDEWFDALSTVDWDVIEEYLDWTNTEASYLEMKAELHYGI
jgi:hypothetical protein